MKFKARTPLLLPSYPSRLLSTLVPIVLTLKVTIQECRNIAMRDLYK